MVAMCNRLYACIFIDFGVVGGVLLFAIRCIYLTG